MHPYLQSVRDKTGKTVDEIRALAADQTFTKQSEARDWVMAWIGRAYAAVKP